MKATISKSHYGSNRAESMTEPNANGQAWQITTTKATGGRVVCSAVLGQLANDMFSYVLGDAKRLTLAQTNGRATEKNIRETHEAGLAKFAEIEQEETKKPVYVLEIGQVFFTDGYENEYRRAIYEIERPGQYRTVLLDGSGFDFDDHVKPYSEKFGIGTYYNEGDKIGVLEVEELVSQARASVEAKERAKDIAEAEAKRIRAEKIEIGRKLIAEIPAGVVSVIVAELRKDESDIQSDYHGHSTEDTLYLAFSSHDRDLFPEMRKAADKSEHTAHLGVGKGIYTPYVGNLSDTDFEYQGRRYFRKCETALSSKEIPAFQTEKEAQDFIDANPIAPTITADDGRVISLAWTMESKELEHREKYSIGAGYYLGHSRDSGWIVQKRRVSTEALEKFQIAAADGKFLCNVDDVKPATTAAPNMEVLPTIAGQLNIIDYSEKAFAVVGDTKPVKDKLSDLGGSFNARLKCGPGWIFSKKRLDAVQKFLQNLTIAA